jgi:hypothetical protein
MPKQPYDAHGARVWPPGSAVYVVAVRDARLVNSPCSSAAALEEWVGTSPVGDAGSGYPHGRNVGAAVAGCRPGRVF